MHERFHMNSKIIAETPLNFNTSDGSFTHLSDTEEEVFSPDDPAKKKSKRKPFPDGLPIVIHTGIVSMMYKYYHGGKIYLAMALGLYIYYYYTARFQGNVRVHAKDVFMRKGTGIGQKLIAKLKNDLVNMGLIEFQRGKTKDGRFTKTYTKVNYVWGKEAFDKLNHQDDYETKRYKIARAMLMHYHGEDEIIHSDELMEFETEKDGMDLCITASEFTFSDGHLYAYACVNNGNDFMYKIPTSSIMGVVETLATDKGFPLDEVMAVV